VYGAALAVVAASVSAVLVDTFVSYKIMGVFWMIAGIGARLAAEQQQKTDDVAQSFSPAKARA
jgi:hypothetical protein